MNIGERIKVYREDKGLSQKELADKAGLSLSFLNELEKGKKQPSLGTVIKISEALSIPKGALLRADKMLSVSIAQKVKELRTKLGMTQVDLANKSGLSPSLVAQIEQARAQPSLETLEKLAEVLGVSPCYLIADPLEVEDLLAAMNPETRRLLLDEKVQSVLRMVCDFDEKELSFTLQFIQLLKASRPI